MIQQASRPYTADDLALIPDDEKRYEVLGGELVVSPSPSEKHQRVVTNMTAVIRSVLSRSQSGLVYVAPFDVHLGDYDILQPDIVVVLREHASIIKPNGIFGVPDMVVEVVSPTSIGIDRIRKAATYAAHGVTEYWIVDPADDTILAQELVDGRYRAIPAQDGMVTSLLLPDLRVDPQALFETPEWLS